MNPNSAPQQTPPQEPWQPAVQPANSQPLQPEIPEPQHPNPQPYASDSPQPTSGTAPVSSENPGQTLGIISIVLSFVGFSLIGMIIGIVSRKKSKAAGQATTLGTTGMVLGIIFTVIGFLIFAFLALITFSAYGGIQERSENTSVKVDAMRLEKYAEAYYAQTEDFPKTLADFNTVDISTIPNDLNVSSSKIPSSAEPISYIYCETGSAQVIYFTDLFEENRIIPLGDASDSEPCK